MYLSKPFGGLFLANEKIELKLIKIGKNSISIFHSVSKASFPIAKELLVRERYDGGIHHAK